MPVLCYVQQAGYGMGNSLDNSRIRQRRDSVMKYVIKDSPLHGLGVFAAEDLPSGSTIERCAYIVIDDDDNRLLRFYTTSDVAAGDELLHDYGSEYWTTRE